ncbi:X-ray radiation resistance-associated protein 1 [Channa argus]|uniref:X-ray radiation resistance-associated protein 1 n=1 Tax=Channa argus TaxID=215402 RepID=A0A6G1QVD3_CHAAH|nr:X-ray radiation resistance-associated protein 1 [Channa argus]
MMFDAADFPFLEVLNLSYNYLSNEDIVSIGRLPCLKVLHLTGNQLQCLLPELPATEDTLFSALEVLMLDDNKLSSEVFGSLTNLKRS